jgi:O-antigen ligase
LQVASAGPGKSDLFLYEITNGGAVGFFANRNHMGTLLLAGLPFAFALLGGALRAREKSRSAGSSALLGAIVLLLLAGIVLNGSTAVLLLGPPVLGFSLLLLPMPGRWRRMLAIAATLLLIVSALALGAMPRGADVEGDMSLQSRLELWRASAPLARDLVPLGGGLGSFEHLFHLYENPAETTRTYVNHAHNDYLELWIELGLAGALLIIAFFSWWTRRLVALWRTPAEGRLALAGSIASAAILAQSLVDYPLRTTAISSLFALCVGLMARPRGQDASGQRDPGKPRHVVIG